MQALLEAYRDRISAIKAVKEGLPVEVYMALKTEMGVSDKVLFQALKISERTIRRRKREGRFKRNESERIMRLVRLHDLAESVFEGSDNAVRWLQQKNLALGLETPLEYASTELGGREVEELLYRIEYNLFAELIYGGKRSDRAAVISHIEFSWIERFCPQLWYHRPPASVSACSVSPYLNEVFKLEPFGKG